MSRYHRVSYPPSRPEPGPGPGSSFAAWSRAYLPFGLEVVEVERLEVVIVIIVVLVPNIVRIEEVPADTRPDLVVVFLVLEAEADFLTDQLLQRDTDFLLRDLDPEKLHQVGHTGQGLVRKPQPLRDLL